jgi:hypothetical protein
MCDAVPEPDEPAFNLDWDVPGAETTRTVYRQNCDEGVTVELWKMEGSAHVPRFKRNSDPPAENLFGNLAIEWLLSHRKQGTSTCRSDIDSNGHVSIEDLLAVLQAWGSQDDSADVDQDGIVGTTDLTTLLSAWGPCP